MFIRPCWRPISSRDAIQLIESNPWALLVSNGTDGPYATNLPLLVERGQDVRTEETQSDETSLVLVSHLARANDHLRLLEAGRAPVLAIFEGPWSYVTASWYPGRDMPSTYYYTAVHCYGRIEWQDESEMGEAIEDLTQRMEANYPDGWRTEEVPREAITRRYKAIRGFRFHVTRIEAKFKLGQDEPLADTLAVAEALERRNIAGDRELAAMIREQNGKRATEDVSPVLAGG